MGANEKKKKHCCVFPPLVSFRLKQILQIQTNNNGHLPTIDYEARARDTERERETKTNKNYTNNSQITKPVSKECSWHNKFCINVLKRKKISATHYEIKEMGKCRLTTARAAAEYAAV